MLVVPAKMDFVAHSTFKGDLEWQKEAKKRQNSCALKIVAILLLMRRSTIFFWKMGKW